MAQIILDSSNNLIQGDFDNATVNNRTKFKTTTLNATTNVYAVPNGSATSAGFSVSNAADPTNASKITIATNGSTDTQIISGVNGSGTYLPLSFYTNNALAAQITTAGNLTLTGGLTVGATAAPAFYAYLGSQQAISASTNTKIALSLELFDTNSNFDSSTNYRFTPTVAGYYQITANARIIGTSSSNKVLHIYKNGNQFISSDTYSGSSGNLSQYMSFSCSALIYFNGSTDYIELYGYSNGSSTAFDGGGGGVNTAPWQTYMSGAFVRSA